HEGFHRVPVAHVAAGREHADAHGHERRLGEQRLLGDVPPRQGHVAEAHVAADAGELERDGTAQARPPAADEGDLSLEAFGDGLRLLFLGHGTRPFRFVLPGGAVPVPEEWRRHGNVEGTAQRRGGQEAVASPFTVYRSPFTLLITPCPCDSSLGWRLPSPVRLRGAPLPCIAARPSAPRGSCWPPSAPTWSRTASTVASSRSGSSS